MLGVSLTGNLCLLSWEYLLEPRGSIEWQRGGHPDAGTTRREGRDAGLGRDMSAGVGASERAATRGAPPRVGHMPSGPTAQAEQAVIVPWSHDLVAALRRVAHLDPTRRRSAEEWLSEQLAQEADRFGEVFQAMRHEDDPALLETLARVIREGIPLAALVNLRDEHYEGLFEALRSGEPVEKRVAAAWALQPVSGHRAPTPSWSSTLAAAIRAERTPRVIAEVAIMLLDTAGGFPDVIEALQDVVGMLPAGELRRRVLTTIGRSGRVRHGVQPLYSVWSPASSGDMVQDIAWVLAHDTDLWADVPGEESRGEGLRRRSAERDLFLSIYGRTADPKVRLELVLAAESHLKLMDIFLRAEDAAAFMRAIAAREPDVALRARLQASADGVVARTVASTEHLRSILCGK